MPEPRAILLTAFEPSGDALGAAFITALRQSRPELRIMAMGGPAMQRAGATLIQTTTEQAVMLHGAVAHALEHRRRVADLRRWLGEHRIDALVPIDSPAANWSICAAVRQSQPRARIVHLVAPQLWAWAPWRIGKLRRLTDHVLCLLPFEPDWFAGRGVKATFVGHPLYDEPPRPGRIDLTLEGQTIAGDLRLGLLPGSRPGEIAKNWPTMRAAFAALRQRHPSLVGVVAAREATAAQQVRDISRGLASAGDDPGIQIAVGQTPDVLRWSDVVLVVSGTATLQVAAVPRPMVGLFNVNRLAWTCVGQFLVQTRTFTLPNLIARWQGHEHVVKELVPHFGAVPPVVDALDALLADPAARQRQVQALERVNAAFAGARFEQRAAQAMLAELDAH
jgi:lipid-A-disaccharide synthase